LVTNHAVSLTGLSANHLYYYQVASRDDAGNLTTDDNQGIFYMFHTLAAPQPPWFDDLEGGVGNWTVVPDPNSLSTNNWDLGTPNNGLQTSAHSGTNAWGSDLKGAPIDTIAGSYLYSPFIDLSGLTSATLTFWDCYDFTSGDQSLEEGQVMVSTNSSEPLTALAVLANGDFSDTTALDWQQETLDLSPYIGQTVQIVWDYGAFTIGPPVHGWLVDDVAITGTRAGTQSLGTVVISKNLGQGGFSLSGPLNQTGNAILTTINNAPLGQYTIQFNDVAFYQTPATQSGTLAPGGNLVFAGNYTFADTNHNGISDAWEQFYFGSVSTNRTQFTDTDHDGMSDFAEFIAGTNPNDATSKLVFLPATMQTNGSVKLQWPAVPGRIYQVQASTNLNNWSALTDWLTASGSPMAYMATNNSNHGAVMFRVEVRP
jgi:hypothetical protein